MSSSLSPVEQDVNWILAYALLDSLASDLKIRRKQGFWEQHPDEMEGKVAYPVNEVPQPNDLLRELRSAWFTRLCDIIFHDTRGTVRVGRSDILRRARA
jgi:hypothetical protein